MMPKEAVEKCPECGARLIYLRSMEGEPELFCSKCGWDEYLERIEKEEQKRETNDDQL